MVRGRDWMYFELQAGEQMPPPYVQSYKIHTYNVTIFPGEDHTERQSPQSEHPQKLRPKKALLRPGA